MTENTPRKVFLAPNIKMARMRVKLLHDRGKPVSESLLAMANMDLEQAIYVDAENAKKGLRSERMIRRSNIKIARTMIEMKKKSKKEISPNLAILAKIDPEKAENAYEEQRNKEIAEAQEELRFQNYQALVDLLIEEEHYDSADIVAQWFGIED